MIGVSVSQGPKPYFDAAVSIVEPLERQTESNIMCSLNSPRSKLAQLVKRGLKLSEKEKCSTSEMIGEFLRELAVLVLVFVPLESYKGSGWHIWHLILMIAATIVVAAVILGLGISFERRRPT